MCVYIVYTVYIVYIICIVYAYIYVCVSTCVFYLASSSHSQARFIHPLLIYYNYITILRIRG